MNLKVEFTLLSFFHFKKFYFYSQILDWLISSILNILVILIHLFIYIIVYVFIFMLFKYFKNMNESNLFI